MANDKLNVFQRINEVRKLIDYIKKDKQVQTYKAVSHDQVTALVRDHLVKLGVVIYPNLVSSNTIDTGDKTSKGTPIIRVESVYEFVFVNIDDPADRFVTSVSAHANDQGDKAPGKALSYAKKAVILKVFEIETGEDDESRYAGFDVDDWITSIQLAQTVSELQQVYNDAYGASLKAKDMVAKQMIIVAKDKERLNYHDCSGKCRMETTTRRKGNCITYRRHHCKDKIRLFNQPRKLHDRISNRAFRCIE